MKAFPQKYPIDASEPHHWVDNPLDRGMDLRDYFAAKAMQGLLANSDADYSIADIYILSYRIADGMMRTREAK